MPGDKSPTVALGARVPRDARSRLQAAADAEGLTVSAFMAKAALAEADRVLTADAIRRSTAHQPDEEEDHVPTT